MMSELNRCVVVGVERWLLESLLRPTVSQSLPRTNQQSIPFASQCPGAAVASPVSQLIP